jgi:hypothetical protein
MMSQRLLPGKGNSPWLLYSRCGKNGEVDFIAVKKNYIIEMASPEVREGSGPATKRI